MKGHTSRPGFRESTHNQDYVEAMRQFNRGRKEAEIVRGKKSLISKCESSKLPAHIISMAERKVCMPNLFISTPLQRISTRMYGILVIRMFDLQKPF